MHQLPRTIALGLTLGFGLLLASGTHAQNLSGAFDRFRDDLRYQRGRRGPPGGGGPPQGGGGPPEGRGGPPEGRGGPPEGGGGPPEGGGGPPEGGDQGPKGPDDLGPGAGDRPFESNLGADPRTRREAIIDRLRDLFRGYVERDIGRFYRSLAPDALFGAGIARNAIMEDFQNLANINVDIEILEYRHTLESTCLRFQWRRVATNQTTGQPDVLQGRSQFCGTRESGFRFQRIIGAPPFGLTDPQFLAQVQAGQPGTGPVNPTPITLSLDFSKGGVFVDLDAGTTLPYDNSSRTPDPAPPPGTDFGLERFSGGGASECTGGCKVLGASVDASFAVRSGTSLRVNDAKVQICDQTTSGIGQVGEVGAAGTFVFATTFNPTNNPHMGVETSDGGFALVAWDLEGSLTYVKGSERKLFFNVSEVCSTSSGGATKR